jgi:hypothetical protein
MKIVTIICAGALGIGTAAGLAACGEDRGSLDVQGGGTTGGTAGATTPSTTVPTTTAP